MEYIRNFKISHIFSLCENLILSKEILKKTQKKIFPLGEIEFPPLAQLEIPPFPQIEIPSKSEISIPAIRNNFNISKNIKYFK